MPIEIMSRYSRQDIESNLDKLFIFGDNYERVGNGGQAGAARGNSNAIGIRTKKAASYREEDFLTDAEFVFNIQGIMEDFAPVLEALLHQKTVVWPADGVGTGLAKLPKTAPATLKFINTLMACLQHVYGVIKIDEEKSHES